MRSAKMALETVYLTHAKRLLVGLALILASTSIYGQSQSPQARQIGVAGVSGMSSARPRRVSPSTPVKVIAPGQPVSSEIAGLERRAFALINAQRAQNGETLLVWDEELCQMAREHSFDMAKRQFFDHVTPEGLDMLGRARARGIRGWQALGENIALNQGFDDPAAFAVEHWMQSTKHRTNILYPGFNRSAIGIARASDGTFYLTQEFMIR